MGEDLSASDVELDCLPIYNNSALAPYITKSIDGTELEGSAAANPCGLIAKSVFTDRFFLYEPGTDVKSFNQTEGNITVDDSNIAWASDVEYKFKNLDADNWQSIQWIDVTNCK